MTAAHRDLPLGTLVRVTNLDNGKSVDVRVNDLGLYMRTLGPDGRPITNYVNVGGQLG